MITAEEISRIKAEIAENLKSFRDGRGIKMVDLSRGFDITIATISDWEQGNIPKAIVFLRWLCETYNLSLDELILNKKQIDPGDSGQNDSPKRPDEFGEFIKILRSDSDLMEYVKALIALKHQGLNYLKPDKP